MKVGVIVDKTFMTELRINHVRHLKDITIPLSNSQPKHLVLTGKNGSGKTSVLKSVVEEIDGDKDYVRVVVSMFGRETPVELGFSEVKKMD